ncbi:hypothetical protein EWB00_000657, partial [Schistosoma japonicum]
KRQSANDARRHKGCAASSFTSNRTQAQPPLSPFYTLQTSCVLAQYKCLSQPTSLCQFADSEKWPPPEVFCRILPMESDK